MIADLWIGTAAGALLVLPGWWLARAWEDRDLGIRLSKAGVRFAFSEAASTKHRSDHTDRSAWKRKAFLYGVSDRSIARKHPDDLMHDPWHYLELVSPLSRPLLISAVTFEAWGRLLAELALGASERVDRAGLHNLALPRLATGDTPNAPPRSTL